MVDDLLPFLVLRVTAETLHENLPGNTFICNVLVIRPRCTEIPKL